MKSAYYFLLGGTWEFCLCIFKIKNLFKLKFSNIFSHEHMHHWTTVYKHETFRLWKQSQVLKRLQKCDALNQNFWVQNYGRKSRLKFITTENYKFEKKPQHEKILLVKNNWTTWMVVLLSSFTNIIFACFIPFPDVKVVN